MGLKINVSVAEEIESEIPVSVRMELMMMAHPRNVYLVIFNVRAAANQHQIACNA